MQPSDVELELQRIQERFTGFLTGKEDPDDFKRFRLENGIYGIRGRADEFMIRVKIRFGALNPEQLECLAEIAERFTPLRLGHITTRQDMQFHRVAGRDGLKLPL
jgi:sulfite reductase beta subunit-like hemoprotein